MSEEESKILRQRAAEVELTVSAYLRSCTFEVESLRAQVKDALTAMRKSAPGTERKGEQVGVSRRDEKIKFSNRSGRVSRIWSSLFRRRSC